MVYVALLRGINVGGKAMISMAELKQTFETEGMQQVKTYINSGNVVFQSSEKDVQKLTQKLETVIEKAHNLPVRVLLKTQAEMQSLAAEIPADWVQGKELKCDVAFLWAEVDTPTVLSEIPANPEVEDVRYLPGVVLRKIPYSAYNKGRFTKIIGTPLYKSMTLRNTNTVRKLIELMQQIQDA